MSSDDDHDDVTRTNTPETDSRIAIETDKSNEQTVYNQYWKHARHVENQLWSYTRIWAVILTGIFTIVGSDLPTTAQAGAAFFGVLLSFLGLFMVYTLRIPFIAFTLKSEALAIDQFDLDTEYTRFINDWVTVDDDGDITTVDFSDDKGIDVPDILVGIYTLVMGAMLYLFCDFVGYRTAGMVVAAATTVVILLVYWFVMKTRHEATAERVVRDVVEE
ncbi:hypothetical protein [Haloarchaeobius amylolyticus]|uniref:hypothetical protein n=1 Tax=Haloarchaeobius amylolyticus TaxID=1198296 RepID=UPI00226E3D65|nr:hypothetical protein [Haloarchaeobius amylolyticus]